MSGSLNIIGVAIRGLVLTLLVFLMVNLGLFERLEGWGFNAQLAFRGTIAPQSPIVIISIDEDSFDELEFQWPWPRSIHAQLLHSLQPGNPAAIGFDVLFTEPSHLGAEDDQALGQAVAKAEKIVLAAALSRVAGTFYLKENLNPPIPIIRNGAAGFGPVNLPLDADAFVRTAQPTFLYQKTGTPSFDALIFELARNAGLTTTTLPEQPFTINFRGGPQTFETLPFYRVVNGEIPPEYFRNKIVLIGATSPLLHDVYAAPFATSGTMPGVELHANVLETMLQDLPIQRISRLALFVLTLGLGMLGLWITHRLPPIPGGLAIGMLLGGTVATCYIGIAYAQLWIDLVPVSTVLVFGYIATTAENSIRERQERLRLSQYFSPSVLKDILRRPAEQRLHSQRRIVTVLFSDIRNFSGISEQLSPEDTASFLREYFTEVTAAVFQHGGMVDKYMGDATMALFNAPLDQPHHAQQAILAALDIQVRVAKLGKQFLLRHGQELSCGIGIHTGEAIVGTMGSKQRFEYTAVGDAINLGARLESLTKEFPTKIIFSEATYRLIQNEFPTQHLGLASIKGKDAPINIYTVTC